MRNRNPQRKMKIYAPQARAPTANGKQAEKSPKKQPKNSTDGISIADFLSGGVGTLSGGDLSVVTYYICMRVLSEALGKLEIRLMDKENNEITAHETVYFLKNRPNSMQTPSFFKKIVEFSRNHYGNGYVYVARDQKGRLTGLYPLDPRSVQIWINDSMPFSDRPYWYFYTDPHSGKSYWLNPEDILHFRGGTPDPAYQGIAGKSVRQILAESFAGEKWAQRFQNDLYQRGLTANAVIHYTGDLKDTAQKAMIKKIISAGGRASDKIIPLPIGFDVQPLNLKLTDSQFYELREFNALQIAAAFGVNPNQLNIYDKSSYNNSEMQNLAFLVDTLAFILKGYEEELNYKLLTRRELAAGLSFRFNTWDLLRGDIETQQRVLTNYVNGGVYSPNEARHELDKPPVVGGDMPFINGAYIPLDKARVQTAEGGENIEFSENQE